MTSPSLIGFVYNAQQPTALQMTEAVMRSLNLGDECWMSPAANLDAMRSELLDTRLIVMAGGDGTILRVVRTIAELRHTSRWHQHGQGRLHGRIAGQ